VSHYNWLSDNLIPFLKSLDVRGAEHCRGYIVAHGDKCYSYRQAWEEAGIPFEHGVAIYLLTYISPFSSESRETTQGWVKPVDWVIDNYERFKPHLGEA
jgi:hypothetical protein